MTGMKLRLIELPDMCTVFFCLQKCVLIWRGYGTAPVRPYLRLCVSLRKPRAVCSLGLTHCSISGGGGGLVRNREDVTWEGVFQ